MATKPLVSPPTAPYSPTKTRTTITDNQIAQAAYNAGFRGQALTTAIAVALAESHGNTTALNNHGEFSVGLFQINVNGYLASRLQRWGLGSWTDLWDPNINAKAAYKVSNGGQNFGLWSTYKHGTYLKYADRAQAAAKTVDPNAGPVSGFNTSFDTGNNSTDPANSANAQAFLDWWNANPLAHTTLSSWNDILNQYQSATGNQASTDYIKSVLGKFGINLTDKTSPYSFSSNAPGGLLITYLNSVAGSNAGIFQPVLDFINGFVGQVEHGIWFLVLVVVGLVILAIGFKIRPEHSNE